MMEKHTINIRDFAGKTELNFNLGIGEDFANNLYQSSLFNDDYMEKIKQEKINSIIDYEKHIFYPAYLTNEINRNTDNSFLVKMDSSGNLIYSDIPGTEDFSYVVQVKDSSKPGGKSYDLDNYAMDVNKFIFNLYLKTRYCDENNDYGEWEVKDESYWNRWDGTYTTTNSKKADDKHSTKNNGDLLGCLGFTDDDVFYQKNNLKKSFLRISIYDSPYRQSQRLLYYSTLFFDTNVLYKKFVNLGKYIPDSDNTMRVYQTENVPDNEKLTASFSCTSKFDNTACSDGFYLYLFNTVVKPGQCRLLYMKIEFNNAKYGKSIPLICPRESKYNDPISILDNNFPEDYEVMFGDNDNSFVDIKKLYNDMYIPIFVRYNNKKNRFEWYIASNNSKKNGDNIIINLYEPRINKIKQDNG